MKALEMSLQLAQSHSRRIMGNEAEVRSSDWDGAVAVDLRHDVGLPLCCESLPAIVGKQSGMKERGRGVPNELNL